MVQQANIPANLPVKPIVSSGPKRDFLEARQVSIFELFDSETYRFDVRGRITTFSTPRQLRATWHQLRRLD